MNTPTTTFLTAHLIAIGVTLCTVIALLWATPTQAQSAFTATLDIGSVTVISGQPVDLNWYVTGGPATCSIDQGIGSFTVTADPQGGTFTGIVPPADGSAFTLSCTRGGPSGTEVVTDNLVIIPDPVITLTTEFGTSVVNDLTGSSAFGLYWEAQYATACSEVTYTLESSPSIVRTLAAHRYNNRAGVSTLYTIDGQVQIQISETATFSISCDNTDHGTQTVESVTVTVSNPPPPSPPVINVITPVNDPAVVTVDPVRKYATVLYEFEAQNHSWCREYKAYNLLEYPDTETTLPAGYYARPLQPMPRSMNLQLGTSTVLTVRCGRDDVTIAGVLYPATSTTLVKTFTVANAVAPDPTPASSEYATTSITATPNPAQRTDLGYVYVTATVTAANADYCTLRAFRSSDNTEYTLPGWTRTSSWNQLGTDAAQNLNRTFTPALVESTILESRCTNIYDDTWGSPAQQANATAVYQHEVVVNSPAAGAAAPTAWLYSGPSVHMNADDIWNSQTALTNMTQQFVTYTLDRNFIGPNISWSSGSLINANGSISFPFTHPHGTSTTNVYNIHMRICDEADGAAQYTVSTDRDGVVGSYTADVIPTAGSPECDTTTQMAVSVANDVELGDGDIITIDCTAEQTTATHGSADRCLFSDVYFGTGSGSTTYVVSPDPANLQTPMMWMSEGATTCHTMEAITTAGVPYTWAYSSAVYGSLIDTPIATSTVYQVTCDLPAESLSTTQQVEVIHISSLGTLTPEEVIADTQGYTVTECWEVDPTNTTISPIGYSSSTPAPPNHVQAPVGFNSIPGIFTGIEFECIPLVDLSVDPVHRTPNLASDVVNDNSDGIDNVNGLYNLKIIPHIENHAPIALPANSQIIHQVTLDGVGIRSGITDQSPNSGPGIFSNALPANTPADTNTYTLPTADFLSVRFGTYNIQAHFNLDCGSTTTLHYPDADCSNNSSTNVLRVLDVPPPHIVLSLDNGDGIAMVTDISTGLMTADPADRQVINNNAAVNDPPLVRAGEEFTLSWAVNVNYPMSCTLTGPSIGTQSLTLSSSGSNPSGQTPSQGSSAILTLQNTSEFKLDCVEPDTGHTFSYVGLVEVVPNFNEL